MSPPFRNTDSETDFCVSLAEISILKKQKKAEESIGKDRKGMCLYVEVIFYSGQRKELSTNNRYKFAAIFVVFPGFFLNKL